MKKSKALMAAFGAAVITAGTTAVSTHAFGTADSNSTGKVTNKASAKGGDNTATADSNSISATGVHTGSSSVVTHGKVGGTKVTTNNKAGGNKATAKQTAPAKGGSIRIHF